jgi:ABC-type dipeptide/oligopeptide/nickel transport system permease component
MQLAILAVTLGSLIGILMWFIAVMRRGSLIDSTCRIVSSISYSMPTFWSGLLLMYIFAVRLKWLPAGGGGDIRCSILPALNLTIYISGWTSRVTRASMLDVLVKDYVLAARAKGLPPRVLLYKHVFKNALIPVFTTIGLQLGSLLGGAFITETIFNYPGLGWLIITYIFRRDYPVIQGGILLAGIAFCFVNLIVDVLYTYLDPRVRYEKKS